MPPPLGGADGGVSDAGEPQLGPPRTLGSDRSFSPVLDRRSGGANTPAREATMPIVLNFDGVSAGDRPEFWHEACADTFVGVDVQGCPTSRSAAACALTTSATSWSARSTLPGSSCPEHGG